MRSFSSRDDDVDSSSGESWQALKNRAKHHFDTADYHAALQLYRRCLLDEPLSNNPIERSLILSNMVACRLKLGGPAHSSAAVQDAKQCVQLNPTWAKAHLRLATAFLAVGNESNAACNALQTCIRLDPNCQEARRLLVQELSRRDGQAGAPPRGREGGHHHNHNTAHDEGLHANNDPPPPPHNPHYQPNPHQQQQQQQPLDIDDQLPWTERVSLAYSQYCLRLTSWYSHQNETTQSLCKIGILLIILYVAFGGRFGLEYLFGFNSRRRTYGHYSDNNGAYQQYRQQRQYSSNNYHDRPEQYTDDYSYSNYYGGSHRGSYNSNNSWGGNYNMGSIFSLNWIIGAIMTYSVYRWYGLVPAIMMLVRRQGRQYHHHNNNNGWNMYGMNNMMFGRRRGPPRGNHHGRWW